MTDTDEIIAMERAALRRWANGDPSGYLEISDPGVTYFDPFVQQRLNSLTELTQLYEGLRGQVRLESHEMLDIRVQQAGEAAVLTFRFLSTDGDKQATWNCTEVYHKTDSGHWRILHTHWSRPA